MALEDEPRAPGFAGRPCRSDRADLTVAIGQAMGTEPAQMAGAQRGRQPGLVARDGPAHLAPRARRLGLAEADRAALRSGETPASLPTSDPRVGRSEQRRLHCCWIRMRL